MLYYLCYIYIIIYRGKTKAIRREGQSLDGLPSFPPRTRPPPSHPSGSKGKVEQKSKQKGRKRESGRRMPPPSSPLFCFVCCLHRQHHSQPLTPHYVAPSPKGRAATPSASGRCHRRTSPATRRAATRAVGHPPRLVLVLASLLFRLMPPPSTPSPTAHPSLRRTITEWKGGYPVRFWSMSSPHLASNQKGSDSGCRSSSPPRPRPRLSSPLSGGEGRETSQPGRAIPCRSPRRHSPPCR